MHIQAKELNQQLSAIGVVPVVAIEDARIALSLADALLAGEIPAVEVTFRTAAAAEVIKILARERPKLLLGAGTVLTLENLERAKAAGAQFAVAPGLNADIVRKAQNLGIPFVPGVATPSEIEHALSLGCDLLKFFPAELLGGVEMIIALSAPYGHTGIRFIPTGGVTPSNLEAYLRCKLVAAVGGTWVATKELLESRNWAQISQRCREALKQVRKARRTSE